MTKRKTETVNDLSRCLDPLDTDATLIAVIEEPVQIGIAAGHLLYGRRLRRPLRG